MKFLKSLNSVIFLQHVKQLIILYISSYSLKVLRVITVLLFRLVDTGTGRRARRGWQGEVHTEDRLPGESKALEGVRRNRQDTGQVFNVSSNLTPQGWLLLRGQFPAETMAQKFNIPSVVTAEDTDIWSEITREAIAIRILNCVLPHTCFENGEARAVFARGKEKLSSYASAFRRGVEKSLKPSSGWFRLVRDAGEAGMRGEDCEVLYRDCDEQQVPSKDTSR